MSLAGMAGEVGSGGAGLPTGIAPTLRFALQGERGEKGERGEQVSWRGLYWAGLPMGCVGVATHFLLFCRAETALLAFLAPLAPLAPR